MKQIFLIPAMAGLLAVSACSESALRGKDAALIDSSPGVNTGRLTPEGEADFLLAYQYVRAADVTTNMPTSGGASYIGGMGADATGGVNGFMTGALDVTVHDLNNGSITGSVTEMAVYDDAGKKTRDFDGALSMTGAVTGNTLATNATGAIADGGGSSNVTVNMNGTFRSVDGPASGATGTVTGGGTGGTTFTLSDGKFYLVEN